MRKKAEEMSKAKRKQALPAVLWNSMGSTAVRWVIKMQGSMWFSTSMALHSECQIESIMPAS